MLVLPEPGSELIDVALRTAIVYVFLVAAIRLSGKREVGQLSILQLVVILVISDAVQNSMVGENTSVWGGVVAVTTLLVMDRAASALTGRSVRLRNFVEGEPRVLVRDGEVLHDALADEGVGLDELQAAVRAHSLARLDLVQLAVLETNGTISIIPMPDMTPPASSPDPSPMSATPPEPGPHHRSRSRSR